jgi:hypothetical protein
MMYSEYTRNCLVADRRKSYEERLAQVERVKEAMTGHKPGIGAKLAGALRRRIAALKHKADCKSALDGQDLTPDLYLRRI